MHLARLIAALAPAEVANAASPEISDLAYDTRAVQPGALFFCVPGSNRDGHELAAEAIAAGAAVRVVGRLVSAEVPQLVVPSVRRAMPIAANEFFDWPSRELEVAGITG